MDQDITTLEKELISISASIPSRLGGGNHGHAGIIVKVAKYLAMAGVTLTDPTHPRVYLAGLAVNAAAGTQAREEAKHKECLAQFEIFKGVKQALKDIILEGVEHDYLLEIKDETLGFLNQMPRQIINHLKLRGGALDFADTKTLLAERDASGKSVKIPRSTLTELNKQSKHSPVQ
jgi:hypothetical protein